MSRTKIVIAVLLSALIAVVAWSIWPRSEFTLTVNFEHSGALNGVAYLLKEGDTNAVRSLYLRKERGDVLEGVAEGIYRIKIYHRHEEDSSWINVCESGKLRIDKPVPRKVVVTMDADFCGIQSMEVEN